MERINITTPIVEIKEVYFSYNATPVLEQVNLRILESNFVCLIGPNGGGKTTLLKLILGLLKPTQGKIQVCGEMPEKVRACFGYLPQQSQFDPSFPAKVMDLVLMGRLGQEKSLGWYKREDREIAGHWLAEMGLYEKRNSLFASLSGGQKKRALLARALATEPKLLMLDEPAANLDATAEDDLYRLLYKLNEKMTIIMVSHELGRAMGFIKTLVSVNRCVTVHTRPHAHLPGIFSTEMMDHNVPPIGQR